MSKFDGSRPQKRQIRFSIRERIVPGSMIGIIPYIAEAMAHMNALPEFEEAPYVMEDHTQIDFPDIEWDISPELVRYDFPLANPNIVDLPRSPNIDVIDLTGSNAPARETANMPLDETQPLPPPPLVVQPERQPDQSSPFEMPPGGEMNIPPNAVLDLSTDLTDGLSEDPLTPIEFDGTKSFDSGGYIVQYAFDFGDGSSYSESRDLAAGLINAPDGRFDGITQHTYADYGIYNTALTVTNNFNLSNTAFNQVVINDVPDILSASIVRQGVSLTLDAVQNAIDNPSTPENEKSLSESNIVIKGDNWIANTASSSGSGGGSVEGNWTASFVISDKNNAILGSLDSGDQFANQADSFRLFLTDQAGKDLGLINPLAHSYKDLGNDQYELNIDYKLAGLPNPTADYGVRLEVKDDWGYTGKSTIYDSKSWTGAGTNDIDQNYYLIDIDSGAGVNWKYAGSSATNTLNIDNNTGVSQSFEIDSKGTIQKYDGFDFTSLNSGKYDMKVIGVDSTGNYLIQDIDQFSINERPYILNPGDNPTTTPGKTDNPLYDPGNDPGHTNDNPGTPWVEGKLDAVKNAIDNPLTTDNEAILTLGNIVERGQSWTAISNAYDTDGTIASHQFWIDINKDGFYTSNEFVGATGKGNTGEILVKDSKFTNLSSGDYQMKVLVTDNTGLTSSSIDTFTINERPVVLNPGDDPKNPTTPGVIDDPNYPPVTDPDPTTPYVEGNLDAVKNDGSLNTANNIVQPNTDWVARANAIDIDGTVDSYEFWIKDNSGTFISIGSSLTPDINVNHTLLSLSEGKDYQMKVLITDNSGLTATSFDTFHVNDIVDIQSFNLNQPGSGSLGLDSFDAVKNLVDNPLTPNINEATLTSKNIVQPGTNWDSIAQASITGGTSGTDWNATFVVSDTDNIIDGNGDSFNFYITDNSGSSLITPTNVTYTALGGNQYSISIDFNPGTDFTPTNNYSVKFELKDDYAAQVTDNETFTASNGAVLQNIDRYEYWIDANQDNDFDDPDEKLSFISNDGLVNVNAGTFNLYNSLLQGEDYKMKTTVFDTLGNSSTLIDTFHVNALPTQLNPGDNPTTTPGKTDDPLYDPGNDPGHTNDNPGTPWVEGKLDAVKNAIDNPLTTDNEATLTLGNIVERGQSWTAISNAYDPDGIIADQTFYIDTTGSGNWELVGSVGAGNKAEILVSDSKFTGLATGSYNMKVVISDDTGITTESIDKFTINERPVVLNPGDDPSKTPGNIDDPKIGDPGHTSDNPITPWVEGKLDAVKNIDDNPLTKATDESALTLNNVINRGDTWTAISNAYDPDGGIQSHQFWIDINKNGLYESNEFAGSTVAGNVGEISISDPKFTGLAAGDYNMQVLVTDNSGLTVTSIDKFTINEAPQVLSVTLSSPDSLILNGVELDAQRFNNPNVNAAFGGINPRAILDISGSSSGNWEATFVVQDLNNKIDGIKDNPNGLISDSFEYYINGTKLTNITSVSYEDNSTSGSGLNTNEYRVRINFDPTANGLTLNGGDKVDIKVNVTDDYGSGQDFTQNSVDAVSSAGSSSNKLQYTFWIDDNKDTVFDDSEKTQIYTYFYNGGNTIDQDLNRQLFDFIEGQSYDMKIQVDHLNSSDQIINSVSDTDGFRVNSLPKYTGNTINLDAVLDDGGNGNLNITPVSSNNWNVQLDFQSEFGDIGYIRFYVDVNHNGNFSGFLGDYSGSFGTSGSQSFNVDASALNLVDGESYVMRAEVYVGGKGFESSGYDNSQFVFHLNPDVVVDGNSKVDNLITTLDSVSSGGVNGPNIIYENTSWTAQVNFQAASAESDLNYEYWIDSDRNGFWDDYERVDLGTGNVSSGQIQIDPSSLNASLERGHGYRMQVLVTDTITGEKQYAFDTFMVGFSNNEPLKIGLDAVGGDNFNTVVKDENFIAQFNYYSGSGTPSINSSTYSLDLDNDGSYEYVLGTEFGFNNNISISGNQFNSGIYKMQVDVEDVNGKHYFAYDSFKVINPSTDKIAVSLDAVDGDDYNFIEKGQDFNIKASANALGNATIDHYDFYIDANNDGKFDNSEKIGTSTDGNFLVQNNTYNEGSSYNLQVKIFDTDQNFYAATSSLNVKEATPYYFVFLFLEYSNIDDFDKFEYYFDTTGTPNIIDVGDDPLGTIILTHPSPGVAGIQLPAPGGASVDPSGIGTKITFIDPTPRAAGTINEYDIQVTLLDTNTFVTHLTQVTPDQIVNMKVSLDAVDGDNYNFIDTSTTEFTAKANALAGSGITIDHYEFYVDSNNDGTFDQFLGNSSDGILGNIQNTFSAGTYNMQVKVIDTNNNEYTAINSFTIDGTEKAKLEVSLDAVDNNTENFVELGQDFTTKTFINEIGNVKASNYNFYIDSDNNGTYETILGTSTDGTLAIKNSYVSGTYNMEVKVTGTDGLEYISYNSFTVEPYGAPGTVGGINFGVNPNPVNFGDPYAVNYASVTDVDGKVNHWIYIDPNVGSGYTFLGYDFDRGGIDKLKADIAYSDILLQPGETYRVHTDISDTDGYGVYTEDKFLFVKETVIPPSPVRVNLDSVADDSNNTNSLVDFIKAGQDWTMSATATSHEIGDIYKNVAIDKFDFWIDLNRDGTFDTNEFIGSAAAVGNSGSITVDHTLFNLDVDKRYLTKVVATDINGFGSYDYDALQTLASQFTTDYVKVNLDTVMDNGIKETNVNLILNGQDWIAKANAISNSTGTTSNNGIEKYEFYIDTDETSGTNWIQVLDDNNPLLNYSTTGQIKVTAAQFNSLSSGSTYDMKVVVLDTNGIQNTSLDSFTVGNSLNDTKIALDAWVDTVQFPKSGVNEFEWFDGPNWVQQGPVWNVGINTNLAPGNTVLQYKLWIDENGNGNYDVGEYSQTVSPVSIALDAVSGGNVISKDVNIVNTAKDWTATASYNNVSGINIQKYNFWIDANGNNVFESNELVGESKIGDLNFGSINIDHTLFNFSTGQPYNMKVSAFDNIGGVTSNTDTFIAGIQNTKDYLYLNLDAVAGSDTNNIAYGQDWTISAQAIADSSRTVVRYEFWIDLNQDGRFDGSESLGYSSDGKYIVDHNRLKLVDGQTYNILSHAITVKGSSGNWTDFSYNVSTDQFTVGTPTNLDHLQINRGEMNLANLPNASGTYTMHLDTTINNGISNSQISATDSFEILQSNPFARFDLDAVKNDGSLNSQTNLIEAGSDWTISTNVESNVNWSNRELRFWIDANSDGKYQDNEELYWNNYNRNGEINVHVLNYDTGSNILTIQGRNGDINLDLNSSSDYTINSTLYQGSSPINRADTIHFTPRIIDGLDAVTDSSPTSNDSSNIICPGTNLSSIFNITDPYNRIQDFQFQIIDRDTNQALYTSIDYADSATLLSAINTFDTSVLSQGNYQLKLLLTNDINIQSHQESNFQVLPSPNATPTLLNLDPVHSINFSDPINQADNIVTQNQDFNMLVKVDNPNGVFLRYSFFIDHNQDNVTGYSNYEDVALIISNSTEGANMSFNPSSLNLAPGTYSVAVEVRDTTIDNNGPVIGALGSTLGASGTFTFTVV